MMCTKGNTSVNRYGLGMQQYGAKAILHIYCYITIICHSIGEKIECIQCAKHILWSAKHKLWARNFTGLYGQFLLKVGIASFKCHKNYETLKNMQQICNVQLYCNTWSVVLYWYCRRKYCNILQYKYIVASLKHVLSLFIML